MERPPDLRVAATGADLILAPYSYCWFVGGQGVCADGEPQEPLPTVTLDDISEMSFGFPLDWQLSTTLHAGGDYCSGATTINADPDGSPLATLGPSGTYRVEVYGRGEGGDAAWAFELVTSRDRPAAPPYVQVLWYPGEGELEADAHFYVLLGNIDTQPTDVSAAVAATAHNGVSGEYELSVGNDGGCWSSSVALEGPAGFTAQVLDLGGAPYTATVTVTVDGQTITSDPVHWPGDFPANSDESSLIGSTLRSPATRDESENAPTWPSTGPNEAVDCAYQYPDDLADMPIAFDGTIVGVERGEYVEGAAAAPVDLQVQVDHVFKGDVGESVTMHTFDTSSTESPDPWDPTGTHILVAAGETLDVMYCGFTHPYTREDAELWDTYFR